MKNTRAFTVLELLLAALILGVLVTIGIAGFRMYQDRAAMITDEANQQVLHAAVKLFAYDTGRLPAFLTGLPPRYYNQGNANDRRIITCPADRTPPPGGVSYEISPGARGQSLNWLLNPANAGADLIIEADGPIGEVSRHDRARRRVVTIVSGRTVRRP